MVSRYQTRAGLWLCQTPLFLLPSWAVRTSQERVNPMSKPALRVVASSRPKLVRDPLADLARSFERSLRPKNRSEHTIASYREAVRQFGEFLKPSHRPQDPAQVRRGDVELFVQHLLAKFKPSTASNRFRSLQQFFRWCVQEDEI